MVVEPRFRRTIISGLNYIAGESGIDSATESLQIVDYEHHEIHSGSHYFIAGSQAFSNGQVVDFTVITPNTTKWLHMTFNIEGTSGVSIEVKEAATVNVAGTPVTVINNDRNSTNTTGATIRTGDTFTSEGTSLFKQQTGANQKAGSLERNREIILKQNTTYIFRLKNETAVANQITYAANWYEHTNKN